MKQYLLTGFLTFSLFSYGQNSKNVDFLTADAKIKFDLTQRKVIGEVKYQMEILSAGDSIRIDARNMHIKQVKINGNIVKFNYNKKRIALPNDYAIGKHKVDIQYEAIPKQAMYFVGNGVDMQIWTQGQGKNNSYWIPSFDDTSEKVIFSLNITFDKDYQVIANGKLSKKTQVGNQTSWTYQMNKPMSSYLLMMAIGKYASKTEKSKSQISIENYYLPKDESKYKNTYKHTTAIFNILEEEIGVNYPWEIYRNIPVNDFMYSGMENTTSTIFNQNFVVDDIAAFDRSYVNVNAHEMAHQWFGNLITAKNLEDHWLQEGFATYYALIAEREIYGAEHFYWKLYEMAEKIQLDAKNNSNTKVVSQKATTTTYYDKGAWAIFYLTSQIGEQNLQVVVQNFLKEYAYKNATTEDFLRHVVEVAPNFNIEKFKTDWLYNQGFLVREALQLLMNSNEVNSYLQVVDMQKTPFEDKKDSMYAILTDESKGIAARKEVIYQLNKIPYAEAKPFYEYVANSNNKKLRQALVQIIEIIPEEFVDSYESFLQDSSYITQEMVLKNLWYQRTSYQHQLLDKTENWVGMPDKNLRISWLMLALKTENYHLDKKPNWYRELEYYATNRFPSDVRQNAINAMWFLNPYDSNVLPQLINGLVHHNSRFSTFCRDAIKNLSQRKEFKEYFTNQIPYLPIDEHDALKKVMDNL